MGVPPLRVAVLSAEPYHAAYLANVLRMELPGLFNVRHVQANAEREAEDADLVFLEATPSSLASNKPLALFGQTPRRVPVIVLARGLLELSVLERLIFDGAEDVLDLAQLNTRALAAAVLKAIRRRARLFSAPVSTTAAATAAR